MMATEPSEGYVHYKLLERHLKKLDEINARIIVEMCKRGSNNVSLIARYVDLPIETVRYRINKMQKMRLFGLSLYFRYSRLGLLRAIVLCEVTKPKMPKALRAAETLGYWRYISRAHGKYEGLYALYAFPQGEAEKMREYYEVLLDRGIVEDFTLIAAGDSVPSIPDFSKFDFARSRWKTPWETWPRELQEASTEMLEDLNDPKSYLLEADSVDVRLVELVEAFGLQKFSELGSKLGLTAQGVRHHYVEHLYGRKIVMGFLPNFLPLPVDVTDLYLFFIHFSDTRYLARFSNTLPGKYILRNYSKILGKNSLILTLALTRSDSDSFFDLLYYLAQEGWVLDFSYSILDLRTYKAYTVPSENFVGGQWKYDHSKTLQTLDSVISRPL